MSQMQTRYLARHVETESEVRVDTEANLEYNAFAPSSPSLPQTTIFEKTEVRRHEIGTKRRNCDTTTHCVS